MRSNHITSQKTSKPDAYIKADHMTVNGRNVEKGTEVTVKGKGRCRFVALVLNPKNGVEWVDVIDKRGSFRSARPEDITTVHRTVKCRKAA